MILRGIALLKKSPNLVTKHELCNVLWGTEECIDENALQVTFTRLRKTLREFGLEERIESFVFLGNLFANGTSELPTLISPCPASTFVI